MAKGRSKQMRMHAVNQAGMVWGMFQGLQPEQLHQFIETGVLDEPEVERIPYDPKILEDLQKRAK